MAVRDAPRRWRVVAGAAALSVAVLLPLVGRQPAEAAPAAPLPAAGAVWATAPGSGTVAAADTSDSRRLPITVGAMRFSWLPTGLGELSSFDYSYDDVSFTSAVWESQIPNGWRVDLHLTVMSGDRLSDGKALHDWFIDYRQRPPEDVDYRTVTVLGQPGWMTRDQLFYLVRPGLAVSITVDPARWSTADLWAVARHAHPARRYR